MLSFLMMVLKVKKNHIILKHFLWGICNIDHQLFRSERDNNLLKKEHFNLLIHILFKDQTNDPEHNNKHS